MGHFRLLKQFGERGDQGLAHDIIPGRQKSISYAEA